MKKRVRAVAAVLSITGLLAACGSSNSSTSATSRSTPAKGGTLDVLQTVPFSHLDPAMGYDTGVIDFYQLIYRTLTAMDSGSAKVATKVVPDLATNLGTHNKDATVWTYHLKKDIYFQTGQPITSQDVKFGVERAFDPRLAVGSPYAKLYIAHPKSYQGPYKSGSLSTIQTPNSRTIIFHLSQPVPDFADALTEPVFTPFPDEPSKVTVTSVDKMPIASGPYEVKSYQQGSSLDLVRNPHWTASTDPISKAYPDKIDFTFGIDNATVDQRMISDEGKDVDAISGNNLLPSSLPKIHNPRVSSRIVSGTQGCTTYLVMNTTKPGLKNPLARQAISYAVNKQQVLDAAGGTELAKIGSTMLPPDTPGRKNFNLYPSPNNAGNIKKAKQLLAKAGDTHGLSLVLDTMDQPTEVSESEAVQQSLAKIGIKVKLNEITASSFYQTIGTTSEQHDMTITGWCPDWASGATFLPPLFEGSQIFSEGNSNVAQLNNPAVNAQMKKIEKMTNLTQANAAWSALDEQINRLAPTLPLFYAQAITLIGSNVGGVYSDPQFAGGPDFATVGLLNPSK